MQTNGLWAHDMMTEDSTQHLFRSEYRRELERWLSRGFRLLCIIYIVLGLVMLLFSLPVRRPFAGDNPTSIAIILSLEHLLALTVVGYFFIARRWQEAERRELLRGASLMILLLGSITLGSRIGGRLINSGEFSNPMIWPLFYWHFTACLVLPWTPRESLRPFVPLLIAWTTVVLLFDVSDDPIGTVLMIAFGPGVFIPGLAICSWRLRKHSRQFRAQMISRSFNFMRQEIRRARDIHEAVFPDPLDTPYFRFEYTFRPMRELGGDFIHAHVGASHVIDLALIDVTGHGLSAALTVNRLFGEMERIRAEHPTADPAHVVRLLNRYVYLTMARHRHFATAVVISVDPVHHTLKWSSAGHPPAYLRHANGRLEKLAATTVVLGALPDEEFPDEPRELELDVGDVVIAYTDGVIEARNRQDELYGLDRLRSLINRHPAPGNWPQFIAASVQKFASGRAGDDVLVASITLRDGVDADATQTDEHDVDAEDESPVAATEADQPS